MSLTKSLVSLSVVIPAYNASQWLPLSVPKVVTAIKNAKIDKAEIIIVDDGSSDDTAKVAKALKLDYPVKLISQANAGRFLARCTGVEAAKYEYVLFIDTRVYIGEDALKHVVDRLSAKQDTLVWTSHVIIDKQGNPYARFWEALTFISWRKYFANPRDCSYGIKDFDYYPKGTTCFFVPREIILEANNWFKDNTKNEKASNDDTLLIRRIAEKHNINLSPKFFCTYHARTNLRQYSKHVYHRGKVFVDGFLRRDGNRFFWPLVGFLILSVSVPAYLLIFPQYIVGTILLLGVAWVSELLAACVLKVPFKDALSLFVLSPLFAVLYGAGIWVAVFDIYVRRSRTTN
ncbi:MAG: glycosyltransferase family 2 protein [Patescibacteria group bacterium]